MHRKWFQNWSGSPYYHVLYHQKNDDEAEFFLDNLCSELKPDMDGRLLDAGCGRGAHALYLSKKGYDVTGTDHSYSNIRFAQQFENEKLHFFVHDVRYPFFINYFDVVFCLFTNFGHFDSEKDHTNVLKTFRKSLKTNGTLVLDFINTEKVARNLCQQEVRHVDGIDFYISKKVADGKIVKRISFEHKNKDFSFREEVKAFTFADLERMLTNSGLGIVGSFGDYSLKPYSVTLSERLILICKKADA